MKLPIKILSLNIATLIDLDEWEFKYTFNQELYNKVVSSEINYESYNGFSLHDPNQGWWQPSSNDIQYLEELNKKI